MFSSKIFISKKIGITFERILWKSLKLQRKQVGMNIGKHKSESKEEQLNDESGTENTETSTTDDLQESVISWQELWEDHNNLIYCEEYNKFEEIYKNYYWNLKETFREDKKDIDEVFVHYAEIEAEIEQLKSAGLPTAFASKKSQLRIKSASKLKPVEQIEYLDISDSGSEIFFSAESDGSEIEFETESDYEFESEMAPIKKTTSKDLESDDIKKLHTIQKKGIVKPKPRVNSLLRNAPEFMLQEKYMLKYWRQRFSLFSRFDEGIQLDRESWFSVTPEKVAAHMAKRMACDVVIDGFCGSGGNTIQFAMTCKKVIAIDIDAKKIEHARHNAEIYGVAEKIEFIVGDFLSLCTDGKLKGDIVFLSPPWGGPSYKNDLEYDIESKLVPVGATELMKMARNLTANIALFLPRNSSKQQIVRLAGSGNKCEIETNYLGQKIVGLTAYYGEHFSL